MSLWFFLVASELLCEKWPEAEFGSSLRELSV